MINYWRDRHTIQNIDAKCDNYSMPIIDDAMSPLVDYDVTLDYITRKDDARVGNDAMLICD